MTCLLENIFSVHVCFNLISHILWVLLKCLVTRGYLFVFRNEVVKRLQGMLQIRAILSHRKAASWGSKPETVLVIGTHYNGLCCVGNTASLSGFLRRNSISLEKHLPFLTGGKYLPGSCSACRGVYPEWGHLQSYSQTLLSIPSVVTILKSLSFLGSAGWFCTLLSCGSLHTMLLHSGGPFCGWPPWKHNSRRQSWTAHGPASTDDLWLGLLCSVSSIYTFHLLSVIRVMKSFGPSQFVYCNGIAPFLCHQLPCNGVSGGSGG